MRPAVLSLLALLLAAAPAAALGAAPGAAAQPEYQLHVGPAGFTPAELNVPAGQKIVLHITNTGTGPAEFESTDLNREKVVPAGDRVIVYVGPLRPGTYVFFDDFHPRLRGRIVAK